MKILSIFFLIAVSFAYGAVKPSLEVKAGYFIFTNKKLRKVYDHGGLDLQISGTAPIWNWLQLYTSIEYLQRSGHSSEFSQSTSLWQLPVNVGLRGSIAITPRIFYYLTMGPRYFFLHAKNHSSYVERTICHQGVGGFANTGFTFYPSSSGKYWDRIFIDMYAEYAYAHMYRHPSKKNVFGNSVQLGGFSFGGGFGYAF